jgi:hypothetical protein
MFIIMFVVLYGSMLFVESKVPQLSFTNKQRLIYSGVGAFLWPVTLAGAGLIGAGVYYHNNVKALPFVNDAVKKLPSKNRIK